jgi:ABC-2 type transport system permease protein
MIFGILVLVLVGLHTFWDVALHFSRIMWFLVALALAMTLNFLIFYCISSIAFWIVEIGFLFEGVRIVIILLSGGIFPLEVFGARFVQITNLLPFKYTIHYPINILNGRIPTGEIAPGLLLQVVWIGVCMVLARYLWRVGSQRYVAVGG